MAYTFSGCSKVTSISADSWDTSKVASLDHTFFRCTALTTAPVADWQTSQVTVLDDLFANDTALTSLNLTGTSWNTAKVTSIDKKCLMSCTGLETLNLSTWDTSKVKAMDNVFSSMSALTTLNLSSWNTAAATTYADVFTGDSKLQHLTLGTDFTFHDSTSMNLNTPSTTAPYTGEWQKGSSGDTYSAATLMTTYDGRTMAGTYNWAETKNGGTVTVEYVNGDGETIAESEPLYGTVGQSYETTAKSIDGYTLSSTPDNATGTYTEDAITVTYVYSGNLFFNSTPATLDFGSHPLSATTEIYSAAVPSDEPLQVQNNGNLNSTWTLTAELGYGWFLSERILAKSWTQRCTIKMDRRKRHSHRASRPQFIHKRRLVMRESIFQEPGRAIPACC
ncbi:Internalin-J [Lactiplantibacillus plantarum subsp. plantarum]|uniref:Internalin-J n=1 Tax=Lactiplantibacillus plantarum subsp. plantarum TaxID=337330 RepID=A0A2S3U907_LACPN|nr:Internalin-J [Lactiplantibacillus plantarum subsp. plantarum]